MTDLIDTKLEPHSATVLGIFRIVIGFLFALHGTAKLFGWPVTKGGAVPFGTWPYWWAGLIELVVGALVMVGLFTHIAALLGSGTMAFAYFTEHQSGGLLPIENGGELATLFCFAFLLLAFAGGGAFAVQRRN
ncbi:MAG: DoxX family protein [Mycobacterium sp.]|nr:DoxX family protein [Mycobacterium sp.]